MSILLLLFFLMEFPKILFNIIHIYIFLINNFKYIIYIYILKLKYIFIIVLNISYVFKYYKLLYWN
jgi:hypothetical protein